MRKTHLKYVQVDAFSRSAFRGAQVAVTVMPNALTSEQMQTAAQELALPEVAFLVPQSDRRYELRAFNETGEIDPVGTSALAAAHALFTEGFEGRGLPITFVTPNETITAERRADHTTLLVSPRLAEPLRGAPDSLARRVAPGPGVLFNGTDLVVLLADQKAVETFSIDRTDAASWPGTRLVLTAPCDHTQCDFVVRIIDKPFAEAFSTVCGAAFRALGPFWLERLKLQTVSGENLHRRGGVVHVELAAQAGLLAMSGQAATTVKGIFTVMP